MTIPTDYRGQDLRGESFQHGMLDGADFSEADLRGADFSDASLVGADFSNARLGVSPLTASLILIGALTVSIAAGVAVGLFAETTRQPDNRQLRRIGGTCSVGFSWLQSLCCFSVC